MRIYSVDAASITSGYALLDTLDGKPALLACGVHAFSNKLPITDRLAGLFEGVKSHLATWEPDVTVVEKIMFTGHNAYLQSLGTVCKAVGAVEAAFGYHEGHIYRTFTATQVRSMCPAPKPSAPKPTTSKKASKKRPKKKTKTDLRKLVNRHFQDDLVKLGYPKGLEKKHEDISDAIGLALYTHIQLKTEQREVQNDD